MTNRLGGETSPYLLQHKDNPVHWWPWGPEALAEAQNTGKPILLSVGYAACHWCHVMAHESFENPEIAAVMNTHFINIKVDREERPDLDAIYQQALAMTGQHGGWPLTMFLTPTGEPFWGGTYFPPTARYGRPGFADVLRGVSQTWTKAQDKVGQNVEALRNGLAENRGQPPGQMSLDLLDIGAVQLMRAVDMVNGGLNGAPKFPQPGLFDFLWRATLRTGDDSLREAVILSLDRMCQGGIYDHLGGGFMRYSTDEEWLVPHFEKMLYDNAQLVDLLTLVWQATDKPLYRDRVAETVDWLLRDMMAEGHTFAATLDADSEGHEGRFYVWDEAEIDRLLDPDTARRFKSTYGVRRGGNWEGVTILNRNHPHGGASDEAVLAQARAILWREREKRVKPGRDDKVLADWNGMMIAALAHAGLAFDRPDWIAAARRAFDGIVATMTLPGDRLAHSMRGGRVATVGLVDDLAQMARAGLALHEASGDPSLVAQVRRWIAAADRHHWDDQAGGYFQAADDAQDVIVRLKPIHDNAVPAANGTLLGVLARLFQYTGDDHIAARAEALLDAFSGQIERDFASLPSLLAGFEQLINPVQIVLVGDRGDAKIAEYLSVIRQISLPTRVLMVVEEGSDLPDSHPAHGKRRLNGEATAYVCYGRVCTAPLTDAHGLREQLSTG